MNHNRALPVQVQANEQAYRDTYGIVYIKNSVKHSVNVHHRLSTL